MQFKNHVIIYAKSNMQSKRIREKLGYFPSRTFC